MSACNIVCTAIISALGGAGETKNGIVVTKDYHQVMGITAPSK